MNAKKGYIIGEVAYNHEGDAGVVYRAVEEIAAIGLDAVKFHLLLDASSYLQKNHPLRPVIGAWMFDEPTWDALLSFTEEKGLDIVALCDDVESIDYLIRSGRRIRAIEIHATGINDYFLLEAAARFNGQVVLGISGSTLDEIQYAITFLRDQGKDDILLMYGFQSYPTDYTRINLAGIAKIRALFGLPVGYADHTGYDDPNNEIISVMAAMMGVDVLEKHYTPFFGVERVDYHAAVGFEKMQKIRGLFDLALTVYGSDALAMSEAERAYGNTGPMKKAIVAKRPIRKGESLSTDNLWFKRTVEETYMRQSMFPALIGCVAARDIDADEIIDYSGISYAYRSRSLSDFTHKRSDE
ncbi:MAG: N-acetylneuraminate synthase [Methanomicrobiales archaeon]|nr:N-acetylneuraminate synthase [Methanomicrobiales archaeon]